MKNLTEKELKELKTLGNEIKNQDLYGKIWGTRPPLIFLLQDVEQRFDPINGGSHIAYYDSESCVQYVGEGIEEIYKDIIKGLEEDDIAEDLRSTIESESQGITYEYITKRSFLTHKAAENHLRANRYHYSPKARIYCDYAWRNPEAELVHKLLLSFAD